MNTDLTCPASKFRFTDKQIVRLQETPDEIPEGGTPHTVSLLMHDKLVDAGKPGDRIEVMTYRKMLCEFNLDKDENVCYLFN